MSKKRVQPLVLLRRGIGSHEPYGSLRKTQSIENAEEAYQRHAERINSKRAGAQHSCDVDLEKISRRCGKQCPKEKDGGMP
jgi:hypothetical protein